MKTKSLEETTAVRQRPKVLFQDESTASPQNVEPLQQDISSSAAAATAALALTQNTSQSHQSASQSYQNTSQSHQNMSQSRRLTGRRVSFKQDEPSPGGAAPGSNDMILRPALANLYDDEGEVEVILQQRLQPIINSPSSDWPKRIASGPKGKGGRGRNEDLDEGGRNKREGAGESAGLKSDGKGGTHGPPGGLEGDDCSGVP